MDIRTEFKKLISGSENIGRWVVIRHFFDEHSEFWKPETHEAVGGPAYKFTDTVVETYSVPAYRIAVKTEGIGVEQIGQVEDSYIKFFFEHNVIIKENDEIFDLDYYESDKPTLVYNIEEEDINKKKIMLKERFKVKKLEKYRCDKGRVEYQAVYTYESKLR